jgi:excisionase family DNA binding protein
MKKSPPREMYSSALLDFPEAAHILSISPRHLRRLCDTGKCPAPVRLGGAVRFRRADIEAWLGDGCKPIRPLRGTR